MKKVKLFVKGKVQGVGFRQTTKTLANKMGIGGIVRNEADGSVYIEAFGESQRVNEFIEAVRQSPSPFGHVTSLTIEKNDRIIERVPFEITY